MSAKTKTKAKSKNIKKTKEQQLERNIEELTLQLSEMEDKHIRLKAEFNNFRKRKEKEIIRLIRYEGEDVLKHILSVTDDLNRMKAALEHPEQKDAGESIQKGIELILLKIRKLFDEYQITSFGEIGDILDSELHEALMVREEKGRKENEIIEIFEKGFKYKDRIIRHAKVVVNAS
ncbi:MAG: nucleotide exchange factor GrpE [Fidelibacterota bacterium]